jgi:hypothetical protein
MANNLTNAAELEILDHINLVGSWTPTTPLKLALFTSDPTETGAAGTEVTGGSYARTNVTFGAASAGSAANNADVTFPTATASWGTVTHGIIYDNAGTPLAIWYGPLATSKTIDSGDTFRVPAGSLTVALN